MINGIHHVSLSTADLDRCLAFYNGVLRLPIISQGRLEPGNASFEAVVGIQGARLRIAQLDAGNLHLEIFHYESPIPVAGAVLRSCDVGIRHLCFDVTNIEAEYLRMKEAGVQFFSKPQLMGDQARDFGVKAVYCRDPDNNIVELQEVLSHGVVDRSHVGGRARRSTR
jgi:catechol 2,3-dioxygenase-like lactoylglutathione lyase family enzyme